MPKIEYIPHRFTAATLKIVNISNSIVEQYSEQGFVLTVRQLFYQLLARGFVPNNATEYHRVVDIMGNARLAGLADWYAFEDRTRNVRESPHWDDPSDIVESCVSQYRNDKWANQPYRIQIWIEKDALIGVIAGICTELDVPYFSCRGYTSLSELWSAAQRLRKYKEGGQRPIIFHLGDHDPSGTHMTTNIMERMELFMAGTKVERLALNRDQIEQFALPPAPTKLSDARAKKYVPRYGTDSWELDALEPAIIVELIRTAVEKVRDDDAWEKSVQRELKGRKALKKFADKIK